MQERFPAIGSSKMSLNMSTSAGAMPTREALLAKTKGLLEDLSNDVLLALIPIVERLKDQTDETEIRVALHTVKKAHFGEITAKIQHGKLVGVYTTTHRQVPESQ